MSFPISVLFRGIPVSEALHASVEQHAARLSKFARDIRSCRVVLSAERRPHHHGDRYRVDLHLSLDGGEIHIGDSHAQDVRHEDAYAAVSNAFDAARRCVEDTVRRRRESIRPRRATTKSA